METAAEPMNTKTHRRLRKAYCRLIRDKGQDKVTVSSLVEEADVSRATFYLYFQNIEEFKDDTLNYILNLYIKQLRIFLDAGRAEAKEACKRKNLIFTEDDLNLFACLFENNTGFGFDDNVFKIVFENFVANIPSYFNEKFIKKNKDRFDLFYIGYAGVMRNNFLDYHSDKTYRDVLRTMDIWDYLFPKYKFQS